MAVSDLETAESTRDRFWALPPAGAVRPTSQSQGQCLRLAPCSRRRSSGRRYIVTTTGQGYRFVAPIKGGPSGSATTSPTIIKMRRSGGHRRKVARRMRAKGRIAAGANATAINSHSALKSQTNDGPRHAWSSPARCVGASRCCTVRLSAPSRGAQSMFWAGSLMLQALQLGLGVLRSA
jgi:hypothetical protein